jgi:hypothetical protein
LAVDIAGNATTSAAVNVTVANIVDTSGPSVAITALPQATSPAR